MERIGKLSRLRRYPVKGMAGEDLDAARVTYAGLVGDRVYAFVDAEGPATFSVDDGAQRARYDFVSPAVSRMRRPSKAEIFSANYAAEVTTPEGDNPRVDDPEFTQLPREALREGAANSAIPSAA